MSIRSIRGTLFASLLTFLPAAHAEDRAGAISADRGLASKSYGLYVGGNHTEDGSVLLAGSGEEPSSHWLEIVPAREHGPDATVQVGVTSDASIPGELIEIPQARRTHKYITMNYSEFAGFPPPLTNGGMNEHQVAGRDIWSPSRDELVEMTPEPQRGPQYSDLSRIAMERASSAREAVEIVGELIDKHGFSTYGGNSHLFADPTEGWVLKQMAGGQSLWVAERLGSDAIRVSYPGYIGEIPRDYQEHPDYMGSDNLISFAAEQGWYDPASGEPFNVHDVYGDQDLALRSGAKLVSQAELEQRLAELAPVTVEELMGVIGDPRFVDDESGYGQIARLRPDLPHPELATLWVSPTGSVTAPFIPWRIGVQEVPPEYGKHRYMTKGAAAKFLDPDYQAQEATHFAGRTFKRLMYYTCARPRAFLPEVTAAFDAFEAGLLADREPTERSALALYQAGEDELARKYLTEYSHSKAHAGLELGEALLGSIEARTKVLHGIREPEGTAINAESGEQTVNCVPGKDPDRPPEDQRS